MSEKTTSTSAPDLSVVPDRRLTMERLYTTAGVHPYDEVTWESRDVIQTNWKTGATVFEQRGVEFPDFWSVNASTIVTTKYFRGAPGSESRERGLKQLLDRVVLTYTKAGKEHGYFATDQDAEIFEHELTWMLLHQVFSFNSPVWFNVGTASPQQVSACFILAVDDTMDSILNWYREEGLIFKGGSGAGLNLSRIRSSKELLSSGGTASGPVSFMRGADASAGTINAKVTFMLMSDLRRMSLHGRKKVKIVIRYYVCRVMPILHRDMPKWERYLMDTLATYLLLNNGMLCHFLIEIPSGCH